MPKKYDLAAKIGSYEKDGQQKGIYKNIGAIYETDKGLFMKMAAHFNPAALPIDENGEVWVNMFEPKENKKSEPARSVSPAAHQGAGNAHQVDEKEFDQDIPF